MSNILVALFAYILDKIFGEIVSKKHPVVYMGEFITWFEENYYQDSIKRGVVLVLSLLLLALGLTYAIVEYLSFLSSTFEIIFTSILASMLIAHKMLHDSVKAVALSEEPQKEVAMLVSRDTQNMSESDAYKAAIESYSENLSDGVIAPLFYLLFFGLYGVVFYKVVNTLDSMVGYKNERYNLFGRFAARLDDWLNYIPARLTALLIALLGTSRGTLKYRTDAVKHESPNAGYPITAMALALNIRLGGPTSYFGEVKEKAYFGQGRKEIEKSDVLAALEFRSAVDKTVIGALVLLAMITFFL